MAIESIMSPALFIALLMLLALFLFATELIPLSATAGMVCVSLYLSGILDFRGAFGQFASTNVMIIAGLGIIGESAFRTGAAGQIGILLKKVAKNERVFVFWLVMISGIISGFLSNNGAAAVLISLTMGICISTKYRRCKLIYPITVGAIFGGGMTTIGSNSTLYLKQVLEDLNNGQTMEFFELTPICLLMILISAIYLATWGFNLLPEEPRNQLEMSEEDEADFSKVPKWKMWFSVILLTGTIVAMYFEKEIGINLGAMAIIGAVIVVITRLMTEKQAIRAIPMKAIILYACMVPVSTAITKSGAGEIMARFTQETLGGTTSSLLVILFIYLVAVPITNCMSNSATIIMLAPVALAVAQGMGMDPKATLIAVRLAGTISVATPIAWPGAAMAVEPGGYNFMDYVKVGIPLSVVTSVLTIVYLYIAYPVW